MRKAICLLSALGLVTLVAGCVQESGYPNTGYAQNGYGYNYPSQPQGIGQALGGVFQSNAQPTYYGQPFAQQGYYGQQQGYYPQPQYYGPRRW
jgi:hypothetical protein